MRPMTFCTSSSLLFGFLVALALPSQRDNWQVDGMVILKQFTNHTGLFRGHPLELLLQKGAGCSALMQIDFLTAPVDLAQSQLGLYQVTITRRNSNLVIIRSWVWTKRYQGTIPSGNLTIPILKRH